MRFGWLMAAIAALWAMPAQAAEIKSGSFSGLITSGTADLLGNNGHEIADLSGLNIDFYIDTTAAADELIYIGFDIPNAPNPVMHGYIVSGRTLLGDSVTQSGGDVRLNGTADFSSNNHSLIFDLTGPLQGGFVHSLPCSATRASG